MPAALCDLQRADKGPRWGTLHRHTLFFVAPVIEGATSSFFRVGESYLVTIYLKPEMFTSGDVNATGLPAGTIGIIFNCETPERLVEARESLKRLGRGRKPLL